MKSIVKFLVLFLASYGLLIYLAELKQVQPVINNAFRSCVEFFVTSTLPDAYIETREGRDQNNVMDPNAFEIIFGNPAVIKAEKEFAMKQRLNEFKISSYSITLYIFQMLTVPMAFLIAIFIATPLHWKPKSVSLGISLLILFSLIIGKCVLLVLFNIANAKIGIYTLSDTGLEWVYRFVMVLTLGFSIIFSFCLWLIFGFRKSQFSNQFSSFIKSFQK